jgi:hypothetical protein
MSLDTTAIEHFLHTQIACWNAGDREGFFRAYREAAPGGLRIEYVGRPPTDGWPVLETMWAQQSAKIEVEEVLLVVKEGEAACHNRNKVRGAPVAIDTIELYRFDEGGKLLVRYFVKQ